MEAWNSPSPAAAFIFPMVQWSPVILIFALGGELGATLFILSIVAAGACLFAWEARTRVYIDSSHIVLERPSRQRLVVRTEEAEVAWSPGNLTKGLSPFGEGASVCIREPRGRGGCVEVQYTFPILEFFARRKIERIVGYRIK